MPAQSLPDHADLAHLKHQAQDLLKQVRQTNASAVTRFREFHPHYDRLRRTGVNCRTPKGRLIRCHRIRKRVDLSSRPPTRRFLLDAEYLSL
jgi:hypothetical protein